MVDSSRGTSAAAFVVVRGLLEHRVAQLEEALGDRRSALDGGRGRSCR